MESVDVTHERLAAHREVVDVVIGLKEPYRSVILLRYYQDLSPTEIAARLGRSAATVRSQLSRAHEILRSALDAKFDGGRSVWSGLPLLFQPEGSTGAASGKVGASALIKIAAAVVCVATAAVLVVAKLPSEGESLGRLASASGAVAAPLPSVPAGVALVGSSAATVSSRRPVEVNVGAGEFVGSGKSASVHVRPPRERDLWYAYVNDGQRYGAHRLQVSALADGNYRYEVSARILVDLFESRRQEIAIRGEYTVTPELRPVSMRVESDVLSIREVVTGRANADGFDLSFDRSGVVREETIPFDPSQSTLFSVTVEDWLGQIDPATERARARLINDETFEVVGLIATRLENDADGSEWQLGVAGEEGAQTLKLDAAGVLEQTLVGDSQEAIVRCTAAEARDLEYLDAAGADVLVFPIDQVIQAPDRLEELVVKLAWKEIPFSDFQLEDRRQRILERTETDEGQSAVLEISAPPAVVGTASLPIEDSKFARYLAETRYIKPNDPKILAAARQAIAGTTNAGEAVAALSTWVFDFIESELIAPTLSGPEVLACGRGKCSEYSTLFASMARAVGIPTRVVLGERMVANRWMGHMWNEAWVGHWVTVDASFDEVGSSLLLLKLIHSETVDGTQELRWALAESLSISIEDFRMRESELAGRYETGIEGVTYTNVDFAARLNAPSDDWTLVDKSGPGAAVVAFARSNGDGRAVHFVAFPVPDGTDPKQILEGRIAEARGRFDTLEVIVSEARALHGTGGHMSHFQCRNDDESQATMATEVCWIRGPVAYLLTVGVRESVYEGWNTDLEKLLANFRFLGE